MYFRNFHNLSIDYGDGKLKVGNSMVTQHTAYLDQNNFSASNCFHQFLISEKKSCKICVQNVNNPSKIDERIKNSDREFLLFCIESCRILLSKFIYSERAKKFCEISTFLLSYVVPVKSKVEI